MERKAYKFERKQVNAKDKTLVETSLVPHNSIRDAQDDNEELQKIQI